MSGKKLSIGSVVFVLAATATGNICNAYETPTHAVLSNSAALQSNLSQSLLSIGLFSLDDSLTSSVLFADFPGPRTLSVLNWIVAGSQLEDRPPRFVNHFYNPLNGAGLSIPPGIPSLTWALEPAGTFGQTYSYNDARAYLLLGLTSPLQSDRQSNLALMFRSLGDVLHLIQDLAQPQHTRNDPHPFNAYYEAFVDQLRIDGKLAPADYTAVYPAADASQFSKVDYFWHTGEGNSAATVATGNGMADYSNRGFVTTGTNFLGTATTIDHDPNFPMPDGKSVEIDRVDITLLRGPVGPKQPLSGELWFIKTPVTDTFNGTTEVIRTSTYSIYQDALTEIRDPPMRFSQNEYNFIDMQKLLIPRAVGYSAGLINYFFRGRIDVTLPEDGVYAIVDHTPQSWKTGGCDTPCGFRKVKLQLRNSTPAGEDMGAGTLQLVAKYHLNTCYRSDLSGEFGAPHYIGPECRSADESIVVSSVNSISSLGRRDFVEATFIFASPIPINATDLYLQVIFQGKLGVEDGALAVATVDVREPTFLTFGNHDDSQAIYNMNGTFSHTAAYQDAGFLSLNLELRFKQTAPLATAVTNELDPGFYHRVAVLTDQNFVDYFLAERYFSEQDFFTQEWVPPATVNQTFPGGQLINSPAYVTLRHTTTTDWAYSANARGAAIYWEPGPLCIDGTVNCTPVDKTVDDIVRRFPPFKQPDPVPMTINF